MILAFVEHDDDTPIDASLEAVTMARGIAEDTGDVLGAAIVGEAGQQLVDELAGFGVERVLAMQHDELSPYAPEAWAAALDHIVDVESPEAIVASGVERSQEILARLGARRNEPFAANCVEIDPGPTYEVIRQRWGGSLLEKAGLEGVPKLISVAPHELSVRPVDDPTDPTVETLDVDLGEENVRVRIERVEESDIEGIPLGEARVVVGGGRGVGSEDGFDILEELADELGGTVGASRAAVNEGWRPHDDQIGLTGAKIAPDIYIPCGISGAVQHWVGAKGADRILAINTDSEAAIIQKSDWAVVGDLHEVVPAITEELRDR